jgi:hypothetical protein
MKKSKAFIKILSGPLFCCILFSCNGGPYQVKEFLIKVDSIHVPNVVSSNTPFDIAFFGTVGDNGCFRFEAFRQNFNNNDIYIEAWGSLDYQATVCPAVMVYLDGRKLSLTIPEPGIYNLKLGQPDANPLIKQITVN